MNESAPWTAEELRAWRPPDLNLTVAEWAQRHRMISSLDAAEVGVWRNERTPYLVEVMNAFSGDNGKCNVVIFQKAARIGGSEATRNFIAYTIDQDPAPTLIVYPSEASAREQITNEITPMITNAPRLKRQLTTSKRDLKKNLIETKKMRIYIGWSGSPQSLASRTIRNVILDEVDKFPAFSGKDAGPIALAMRRTQTYGSRKSIIITSTPTTADTGIAAEFRRCIDRRYYHVPCPHCAAQQVLTWSQVRWMPAAEDEDQYQHAARIEAEQSAWYTCIHCEEPISETSKHDMLMAGQWVSDGYDPGEHPKTRRRGYQISALYSMLGITWSDIAANWIANKDELAGRMEFINQVLGEPFESQTEAVKAATLKKKAAADEKKPRPRGLAPEFTALIIATADTQKDHFWFTVHAWGCKSQTRLLDYGKADSFKDLRSKTIDRVFQIENWPNSTAIVDKLYIDAGGGAETETGGSRTDEVYRFCKRDPGRVIPIRGHGGSRRAVKPVRSTSFEYKGTRGRAKYRVNKLMMIDTGYFKDILSARLNQYPDGDELELWQLPDDVCDTYFKHMTSEQKVLIRRGTRRYQRWKKRTHGRRNDLWDCSTYQLAAAYAARVETLPDLEELTAMRSGRVTRSKRIERKFSHPHRKSWVSRRDNYR